MIRMYINNEEVVCDKELTINEEFLATSSTTLKNCYPKSWELTKDYVSNFYFPPDYSKCLIYNEESTPPIEGQTAQGTNININYDSTLQNEIQGIWGDTYQQTYTGISLLPIADLTKTTYNNVDVEINNQVITTSGTSSGGINQVISSTSFTMLANTTYTFATINEGTANITGTNISILLGNSNKANVITCRMQQGTHTVQYTPTEDTEITQIRFYVDASGRTMNYTTRIMLVQGSYTSSNLPAYEPYVGNAPAPSPDYPQEVQNVSGENTIKINGKNLFDKDSVSWYRNNDSDINITADTNSQRVKSSLISVSEGTYTISGYPSELTLNSAGPKCYDKNKQYLGNNYALYTNGTFTLDSNVKYISIMFNGNNLTNEIKTTLYNSNIQIEKSSTATTYEPYKSQTYTIDLGNMELCKIGTYQDYIYKQDDKWYKHSEIGKIILDGSQDVGRLGTNTTGKYRFVVTIPDFNNTAYRVLAPLKCNKLNVLISDRIYQCNEGISGDEGSNLHRVGIYMDSTSSMTQQQFVSYLTDNNIILYYPLATSTETEITDSTLISQLNSLPLYNGINNINMINGNLQGGLKLYYNFQSGGIIQDLLFCGVVKNTGNIDLNPRQPHYCSLQVLDFKTFLSEGETLDFVISNKTVAEAIQMVVNAVSEYGFIVGNIELASASEVIGAYSTLNKTAYDVFQYLADITQSRWFTRMVDQNTVAIDFYDPESLPQAEDLEYSQEYYEENNIIDIKYNYSTKDYRNKQIMLSDEVFASIDYNDTLIADGYNTTFSLLYNIGLLKSVTVNGVGKTIATSEEKEQGVFADFYYTLGSNTIESDELYSVGDEIAIVYTPLVKGRQIIYNDDEIDRIATQTGRSGTITRYETRNDATTSDELQKIGESYIKYKGKPEIKLTVKTYNNDLYNIGQTVSFVNAPLEPLELDYMIKKKTTQIIATTGDVFYTYELTSSFNSESEINYFDNQRLKAQGNLSKDEYITRNIDIEDSVSIIFDNLTISEITIESGNVLDATLDAPFNS